MTLAWKLAATMLLAALATACISARVEPCKSTITIQPTLLTLAPGQRDTLRAVVTWYQVALLTQAERAPLPTEPRPSLGGVSSSGPPRLARSAALDACSDRSSDVRWEARPGTIVHLSAGSGPAVEITGLVPGGAYVIATAVGDTLSKAAAVVTVAQTP